MAYTLVTRRLLPGSLDPLSGHDLVVNDSDRPLSHDELRERIRGANALICLPGDNVDASVIEAGSALSIIATVSVGFDHIDLSAATQSGIPVCHTPDVLDEATADLTLGLIIAASRRMGEAERDLRALTWQGWAVDQYLGLELNGSTLGIVGFGRIGKAVAKRAFGFGMQVVHHSRHPSGEPGYFADLDQMLAVSDVVSLHVPLTEQTRHLIDARRLALMKNTAVLVNTSRGPVVDEEALAEALAAGELKHGTLALVEEGVPVIALATQKSLAEKTLSNIMEVKARGARVIGISQADDDHLVGQVETLIRIPPVPDLLTPALSVLPLQLLAYYAAVARGTDVDRPRNLAKSVTVE